mgnify:CR=1 FL=1
MYDQTRSRDGLHFSFMPFPIRITEIIPMISPKKSNLLLSYDHQEFRLTSNSIDLEIIKGKIRLRYIKLMRNAFVTIGEKILMI